MRLRAAGIYAVLGTAGVALAAPAGAAFHVLLERTTPVAADTVETAPTEVTLTFSGPIEQAGSALTLLGPGGAAQRLESARRPNDPRTLAATLPRLGPGGYRVEWRVVSSDGHPIAGNFVFFVTGGSAGPLDPPPPPSAAGGAVRNGEGASSGGSTPGGAYAAPLLATVRGGADLALLLGAGLLLFAAWGGAPTPSTLIVARTLVVAAPLFAATYAWIWTGEIAGAGAAATAGAASAVPGPSDLATRIDALTAFASGRALVLESALAMLTAWALLLARRPRLAAIFALAAVAAGALSGHSASYTPLVSIPTSALHQLAVAAWAGGLLFLVTEAGSARFAASMQRVSRVAFAAVVVVAITGLAQTWLMLGSPDRLFTTPYGVLVLGKVAGLAGLVAFGAYHRYQLVPRLLRNAGPATSPAGVTPSVALELALAAAVVVLAAVLSHIPPNP